jgi:hypothetical protein
LKVGAEYRLEKFPSYPLGYGVTPLYIACSLANAAIAERLLVAGANPNALDQSGETLLSLATRAGVPDVVSALLNHGAKVDATMQAWASTALMVAIRENESAIVKILLDHGANVNARTTVGQKPARRPAGTGGGSHGVGIIRSGIPESGSQAPTQGGFTPLLYAARWTNRYGAIAGREEGGSGTGRRQRHYAAADGDRE